MAVKKIEFADMVVVHDDDATEVVEADLFSGKVTLLGVQIENDDNSGANAETIYLKLFNNANPTAGTTEPDDIIAVTTLKKPFISFGVDGVEYADGFSYFVSTDDGKGNTIVTANNTHKLTFFFKAA